MNAPYNKKRLNKYAKVEIVFFIVFFLLFPILTDMEYHFKEKQCATCPSLANSIMYSLVSGLFQLLPYLLLYKIVIEKLLLAKKYLYFLLAFAAFLFVYDFYIVYVEYWATSKLSFLPAYITISAAKWFKVKQFFHFSIIYVINQTLVFVALAYFINYAKQEQRMHALQQAKLLADLNYLKAQVQPHFFFNTLNNIYSLALKRSEDTAPLVARLAEMMRYIIYETANQKVTLKKEIDFLKNYIDVEKIRYNDKITVMFDAQGISDTVVIEPLLLLPFIENIFKHGLQQETGSGFAEIIICLTGNELTLQAKNSKPIITTNNKEGIGLKNVQQRLELLYPGKHSCIVNEDEKFYEVILNLQLD